MSRRTPPHAADRPARERRAAPAGARAAGMERRLIERRLEVMRAGGRRRRRVLGLLVAVLTFGIVLWKLSSSSLFDLTGVEVTGNRALTTAEVVAAAGIRPGQPTLRLDTAELRARVERLPYVAHATVTRVPPAGVRIELTERVPAATVGDGERVWLVAADGTVLARGAPATGLPHLKRLPDGVPGPGMRYPAGGAFANALAAVQGMDPRLRRQVAGIEAPSVEGLRFTLGGGAILVYGVAERQAAKDAAALLLLRDAKAGRKEVARVDVRAPRTPVLVTRDAAKGAP